MGSEEEAIPFNFEPCSDSDRGKPLIVPIIWLCLATTRNHESINSALKKNVEPVTDWSNFPAFNRTTVAAAALSDSMAIEEISNDILRDAQATDSSSQLYLVALGIKTEQLSGQKPRIDIVELRTKDKINLFKAQYFPYLLNLECLLIYDRSLL